MKTPDWIDRLRPMPGRVLVKTEPRRAAHGGVELHIQGREINHFARVLAVGRLRSEAIPEVRPGDRVHLEHLGWPLQEYTDDGLHMVVHYDAITGVVEEGVACEF